MKRKLKTKGLCSGKGKHTKLLGFYDTERGRNHALGTYKDKNVFKCHVYVKKEKDVK